MSEPGDQIYSFGRGATLFHEGGSGDFCYLLLSGRVEVFRMKGDAKIRLGEIGEGGVVGEMALIDPAPRAATVVAIEPTTGRRINGTALERALASSPPLARYLLQTFIRNIRHAAGIPMTGITPEVVTGEMMSATIKSENNAMRVMDRKVYQPGEAVFRTGQPGYNLYLVQGGRVDLVREVAGPNGEKAGEERLRSVGPGEVFGELALLTGGNRRASAIAVEATVCETITSTHFKAIVNACPPVVRALMRIYADMMVRNSLGGAAPP